MTYLLRAVMLSAVAVPAMAQAPATLTALAECRLSYAQAGPLLAGLKPVSTKNLSDEFSENEVTFYDRAAVKPFGLAAQEFSRDSFADADIEEVSFVTRVAVSYDRAKAAALKGYRQAACDGPEGNGAKRACKLPGRRDPGTNLPKISFLVTEEKGAVFLRCAYFD